jgi:predicted phosphodiesterase
LKISIVLENLDIDYLRNIVNKPIVKQELINETILELKKIIIFFVMRLLFLAFIGGAFAMILLHNKKAICYVKAGVLGVVITAFFLLGTYFSYDINKFNNPQYKGVLKAAPWMVGLAEEAFVKVELLGEKLQITAKNLYNLFEKIDYLEPLGEEGQIKILHVSDIHNNPAAFDFIEEVSNSFGIDMIVDTGDISDYGTPLEINLLKRLKSFTVPYLFIAGNHDSPAIIEAMKSINNVKLFNDKHIYNIAGITAVGINDPAADSPNIVLKNRDKELTDSINTIQNLLLNNKVNILLVHRYEIAKNFIGKVPLILYGHDHVLKVKREKNTVVVDAGTTGAAGIRALQTNKEIPYTLALIHLKNDDNNWYVHAVDTISVSNIQSNFILQRHVYKKE